MENYRMKHSAKTAFILFALGTLLCHARGAHAQRPRPTDTPPIIISVRVAVPDGVFFGPLYATVGAGERKIADEAVAAWIIQGGQSVVYSGRDGAGGFEGEGQSLRIYDARTGRRRKVMAEYYGVDEVTEVTTGEGATALLVGMSDGGLGASYLAVVDPARGEVFFRRWAKIITRRGDVIVIGHYKEGDWEKFHEGGNAKIRPYKTERQNLNTILRRRVIFNKPDR
jgi:hypothetical protein